MPTNKELHEFADLIRKKLPKKNPEDKLIWKGILEILKNSQFGVKRATVSIMPPLSYQVDDDDPLFDENERKLDFLSKESRILDIMTGLLIDHGKVLITQHAEFKHAICVSSQDAIFAFNPRI